MCLPLPPTRHSSSKTVIASLILCWQLCTATAWSGRFSPPGSLWRIRQLLAPRIDASGLTAATEPFGMPWKTSIVDDDSTAPTIKLTYMPFWEWQIQFMQENLTNLRVLPLRKGLRYAENNDKRMHTLTLTCDEYKYIRMTNMDSGEKAQILTSVWYPDPAWGKLPILGCDMLQFQQKRHMCFCDFQPLTTRKDVELFSSDDAFVDSWLRPIREQYPSLQQEMSGRIYNTDDSHFSSRPLMGQCDVNGEDTTRDDAHQLVYEEFFPAWKQAVQTHVQMVQQNMKRQQERSTNHPSSTAHQVLALHKAFDTYYSIHDRSRGLLTGSFGKEFADDYVDKVLFPLSANS